MAAIAIHGRTRNEAYTGASDWSYIADVKAALRIPVWGNGDVKVAADAVRMFETTAVDGVMIGRAALHNPFIFRDILMRAGLTPGSGLGVQGAGAKPGPHEEVDRRIDAMQRYLSKIDGAPHPDRWKLHKARTVIGWFSHGIAHGKDLRNGLADLVSVAEAQRLLDAARERVAA